MQDVDTLSSIAAMFGTTVEDLKIFNPEANPDDVHAGGGFAIPGSSD